LSDLAGLRNAYYLGSFTAVDGGVQVGLPDKPLANGILLSLASPNPSRNIISWNLHGEPGQVVNVKVFDVQGRELRDWEVRVDNTGNSRVIWDRLNQFGKKVAAGKYLIQATTPRMRASGSVVLLP